MASVVLSQGASHTPQAGVGSPASRYPRTKITCTCLCLVGFLGLCMLLRGSERKIGEGGSEF